MRGRDERTHGPGRRRDARDDSCGGERADASGTGHRREPGSGTPAGRLHDLRGRDGRRLDRGPRALARPRTGPRGLERPGQPVLPSHPETRRTKPRTPGPDGPRAGHDGIGDALPTRRERAIGQGDADAFPSSSSRRTKPSRSEWARRPRACSSPRRCRGRKGIGAPGPGGSGMSRASIVRTSVVETRAGLGRDGMNLRALPCDREDLPCRRQVALVRHDERRRDRSEQFAVIREDRSGPIEDQQDEVGLKALAAPGRSPLARPHRRRGDRRPCRRARPASRRRPSARRPRHGSHRAGDGRSTLEAGHRVEQPALAHVRPAGDDDPPTLEQSQYRPGRMRMSPSRRSRIGRGRTRAAPRPGPRPTSRLQRAAQRPVDLVEQDLRGPHRGGGGEVFQGLGADHVVVRVAIEMDRDRPGTAPTLRGPRPPRRWRPARRGLDLERRDRPLEPDGHDFIALRRSRPGRAATGPARSAASDRPRCGRKTRSTATTAPGPQTRTTPIAPRPSAVSTRKNVGTARGSRPAGAIEPS